MTTIVDFGFVRPDSWQLLAQNVTATTAFDYSTFNYTEYLILLGGYEFFFIPEFGNISQYNGYTNVRAYMNSQTNQTITFYVERGSSTGISNNTASYEYTIYGRRKTTWSLVSDNSALPNYTELATANGYYTPFNYQVDDYRTSGGSIWYKRGTSYEPRYTDYRERVINNAYTNYSGSRTVYTRFSSNETSWNHITSTTSSVSIENINYSEMFIVGREMMFTGGYNNFQALYVIPEMPKRVYYAGAYTGVYVGTRYDGSYGNITISDTSISAAYTFNHIGSPKDYFRSLDIYYR